MVYNDGIGSLSFRLAAAIISATCIFFTFLMRRKTRVRNVLFLVLLFSILIDSITGIIATSVPNLRFTYLVKYTITYACKMVYFATHFAMVPVLCFYIIMICGIYYKFYKKQKYILVAPFVLLEFMVMSNPFTQIIFKSEGNLQFSRNVGVYMAYFISVLYLVFSILLLLRFWTTINYLKKMAMFLE